MSSATAVHLAAPRTRGAVDIAGYFNRVAFAFVPNVCNARCNFCYVAPTFARHARLPTTYLARCDEIFRGLADLGFEEVRFTGGEPLLFENIGEAIVLAAEAGLHHRLITNALDLGAALPSLEAHPPVQLTVSLHDGDDPGSVFGVEGDWDRYFDDLGRVAALTFLECTIVVERVDHRRLEHTLERCRGLGAGAVKFILANVPGAAALVERFDAVVERLAGEHPDLVIRRSDTTASTCRLNEKGFLSLDIQALEAYTCCAEMGSAEVRSTSRWTTLAAADGSVDLARIAALARAHHARHIPCQAAYGACPIALRS